MLTRLVPEGRRERVYGINFMLMNAGIGVGGVVSGLFVAHRPATSFQRIYLVDALSATSPTSWSCSAAPRHRRPRSRRMPPEPSDRSRRWGAVLRDRTLLRVVRRSRCW